MPHQEEPGWPLAHCGFDIEGVAKLGGGFCRVILWSDSFFLQKHFTMENFKHLQK